MPRSSTCAVSCNNDQRAPFLRTGILDMAVMQTVQTTLAFSRYSWTVRSLLIIVNKLAVTLAS